MGFGDQEGCSEFRWTLIVERVLGMALSEWPSLLKRVSFWNPPGSNSEAQGSPPSGEERKFYWTLHTACFMSDLASSQL